MGYDPIATVQQAITVPSADCVIVAEFLAARCPEP